MTAAIESSLEKNRADELEQLLKPAVDILVKQVRDTDLGRRDIGPRFEDPKELYKILDLDKLENLFERSIQTDSEHPAQEIVEVYKRILDNSVNTWHPGFMDKLYAATNPVGVLSDLLLSALNTNSHVFTVSPAITVIERKVAQKYASLFGFTGPKAGGLTFSGGSWSNITSLHMARSLLHPETKLEGNNKKFAIYTSVHSHYSIDKAAILLGLGTKAVFKVGVDGYGRMRTDLLEEAIAKSVKEGYTPLYVNGTAGTTVYGSFDPFVEISKIAKKNHIWFHIDGSWGGNAVFSETKRRLHLQGSELADSITASPHKMLGVPTTCSFLLVPNDRVFTQANSLAAPYLFHNALDEEENFDLANGTMGCGRRADAVKFYLSWLYYGTKGYAQRVDHAYAIGEYFAKKISHLKGFTLISDIPPPCLQVCFYYTPKPEETFTGAEMTQITRQIVTKLHSSGQFLTDFAPGEDKTKGEFFRVVFNSPVVSSDTVDELIGAIEEAGKEYRK